jgi:acyl-CoA synthetase (AMP-forming)/AMP-acid ligase II
MNVYPTEVETIILELPKIFQCAVIGIPDDRWGQAVVAVIKMKEGEEMTDQEVIDHCRSQIAHYKQPTRVIRVETFPVTASEKIKRAELRTLLGF